MKSLDIITVRCKCGGEIVSVAEVRQPQEPYYFLHWRCVECNHPIVMKVAIMEERS